MHTQGPIELVAQARDDLGTFRYANERTRNLQRTRTFTEGLDLQGRSPNSFRVPETGCGAQVDGERAISARAGRTAIVVDGRHRGPVRCVGRDRQNLDRGSIENENERRCQI